MELNTANILETNESEQNLTRKNLIEKYQTVRSFFYSLCEPLVTEDYVIQSMADASPTKWHLAHTSWFFEAFVLRDAEKNYKSLHPQYNFLFNSYYVQIGERHTRAFRGLLSRPTVEQVYEFRKYVDNNMLNFMEKIDDKTFNKFAPIIEIGIHHEQQHQELMITDIKHVFSVNPLKPSYINNYSQISNNIEPLEFIEFDGGVVEIGYSGKGYSYDNEGPLHKEYLEPYLLANRLVTNGEYLEFIEDGGYKKPEIWLSEGYAVAEDQKWEAPMYWEKKDGEWWNFKLNGFHKVNLNEPVCHLSFFEAEAFAHWKDARLPSEAEWESAASALPMEGNFVEQGNFHPMPISESRNGTNLKQMYGDVWEWTRSSYSPYPGYKPLPGALGEYNGKFMSNQYVLRGGSCATSQSHIRKTYRNFFPANSRWQFMGLRLAKDLK